MKNRNQHLRKPDPVVLALCAVTLISCLGAAGRQGRMRAKEMVCLANLHQWHAVFQNYIADNDGRFFTGLGAAGYWWPVQLDEATQNWKKNRTWFCPTATQPLIDEHGNTAGRFTTFNAWGIYGQEHLGQLGPDGIAGSYGLNGYTIAPSGFGRSGPAYETGVPASEGWRDFESVTNADRVPLFLDAVRFDLWPLYTDSPAAHESAVWVGNYMAQGCVNRHNGAVNSLFLNGSARKVGLKELWTLKWHRSFNTAGPWTNAGGAVPSDWPEWMREYRDY